MMSHFALYCACLPLEHIDFDAASEESVSSAEVVDGRLTLGHQSYDLLVIPPTTCISCEAAEKIGEFVNDGGKLIANVLLPLADSEGDQDEKVRNIFEDLFEKDPFALLEKFVDGRATPEPRATLSESGGIWWSPPRRPISWDT